MVNTTYSVPPPNAIRPIFISCFVKQQGADDGARQKISQYGTLPQTLGHGAHQKSTAQQHYHFHNNKPYVHKPETFRE
jgi:hypothetical protein